MTYTPPKLLTFEQFITEYGDNSRYELIDSELRDMEPTGPHEEVSGNIAGRVYAEIFRSNLNWLIPKTCLIKPPAAEATALRPRANASKFKRCRCSVAALSTVRAIALRKYCCSVNLW